MVLCSQSVQSAHLHAFVQAVTTCILCRTPCHGRVYDALPPESRIANARLLQPKDPQQRKACVLHLAGTGDHTWHRRLNLGGPLLQQACLPSCHV